jgi:hypothetical protein
MRKRKAEVEAEKEEEFGLQHEGGDSEGEEGQEKEESNKNWNTPGESPWDDVLPTSISTPDQLVVVVPLQTKRKIWAGGFINLANCLPKDDDENTEKLELVKGQLVKKINGRKINTKDEWTTAFIRYMAVYLERNPSKNVALLRYLDNVSLAAEKFGGLGWRAYDEQFRLSVANNPQKAWTPIDNHLWLLCMTPSA